MEMEKKLKILMLEDDYDDSLLIQRVLIKGDIPFQHHCVDTQEEFMEAIESFQPDVILSDHGLPGFNSREALKISLRERPATPFILVTGMVSDEYAISCIREGADDYILKSNLSRLPIAIRAAMKKRTLEKLKRSARHELRHQNAELLKTNRELDHFVYSVSHNLRGPLASVMGLLNVAKKMNVDKDVAAMHEMMTSSILKLDATLKEILDHSRNSRSEVAPLEINWNEIIEACFSKLSYLLPPDRFNKQIHLQAISVFFSDPERLNIIFTNLLSNTILYRDRQRELTVYIEIITLPDEAIITLKDNGTGIREEVMPKVFDMFFRGTEISEGAGLGLYITREIITRLKGSIQLESVPGQGTTVIVKIPNLYG